MRRGRREGSGEVVGDLTEDDVGSGQVESGDGVEVRVVIQGVGAGLEAWDVVGELGYVLEESGFERDGRYGGGGVVSVVVGVGVGNGGGGGFYRRNSHGGNFFLRLQRDRKETEARYADEGNESREERRLLKSGRQSDNLTRDT